MSSDNNYAQYLSVVISSLKKNNISNSKYDICILDDGISSSNKKNILTECDSGFSIRFINMSGFLYNIDKDIFYLKMFIKNAIQKHKSLSSQLGTIDFLL